MTIFPSHSRGLRHCILTGIALTALALTQFGCGGGSGGNKTASNVVYVESNDPTANTLFAFSRASDGSLTPLSGSPFSLKGQGLADPTFNVGPPDADNQIVASADRKQIFAVNSGSNSIAVMSVAADGTVTHITGSPFPSGGINPVSLQLVGSRLYVANKNAASGSGGAGTPTYTVFNVGSGGALTQIGGAVASSPAGSSAAQILASPDGKTIFTNDFLGITTNPTSGIRSYSVNSNGTLTQVGAAINPPSVVPAGTDPNLAPLYFLVQGIQVHPNTNVRVFYACTPVTGKIAVYSYDASGALTFNSFASVSGVIPCWLKFNKAGSRLYVGSTGDDSISVMDTSNPLAPVEIQRLALKDPGPTFVFLPILPPITSSAASELTIDPTGTSIYIISHRNTANVSFVGGNVLHVLHVNADGTVTEPGASVNLGVADTAFVHGVLAL